jgi:hypothetical protein
MFPLFFCEWLLPCEIFVVARELQFNIWRAEKRILVIGKGEECSETVSLSGITLAETLHDA